MNDDNLAPVLVDARGAGIAEKALERLRKMSQPPKQPAAPKPPVLDQAMGEKQRETDALQAEQKRRQDEAAAAESGGAITIGSVARDVTTGMMETFTLNPGRNALLTGAVNAIDEMGDTLADVVLYPFGMGHKDLDQMFGVIETEGPQSTTGKLVSSITQFGVGMLGAGKLFRAAGVATAGGAAVQSVARGAVGDVLAFDEADKRLSDIVESFPALRNPVTEYLAGDPDDSFIEAKFKQGLEGAIGGTVGELLFRGVKAYRQAAQAKAAQPEQAAAKAIQQAEVSTAADEALELTPRDWAMLGGDPAKPLISVSKKTPVQADELGRAMGPSTPEPVDFVPGEIKVGEKVANINLNRIDGPEQLREVARRVGKMMMDEVGPPAPGTPALGPTIRQSTDEARKLADVLLQDPDTMATWLQGQSATGRAFSREEIIGAGEVLTSNLAATRNLAMKIAKGGATDADKLAFHRSFALQQSMMSLVSQQSREAGRALQAFRTTVAGNKQAARAIREVLSHEGNTEKMANMLLALEHPGQASKFMKDMVEGGSALSRAGNVLMEVWYNSILSGPRTHIVNNIGNTITTMTAVAERGIAARLPGATVPRGEEAALMFGTLRSFKDALNVARTTFRTGVPIQESQVNQVLKRRAITGEKLVPKTWQGTKVGDFLGAGIDVIGTAIRLPGRALMTSDEFWKTLARGGQTSALAYRRAVGEGLTGDALAARIGELRASPPPDLLDEAFDFAAYQTFTNPLGDTGQKLQRFIGSNKLAQMVVPFIQTPVNIMKYATARSPLGLAMKSVRDDLVAGGVRRDLAVARIGLGSIAMATAADYAAQGMVTGAAPGEPGMKAAWDRAGILPYSVKIGDKWVQYTRLDPVGMSVGIAADFANIMNAWSEADGLELGGPQLNDVRNSLREKWGLSEEEIEDSIDRLSLEQQQAGRLTPGKVAGAIVASIGNNVLSRSYLSGLADLVGIFEAPSPEAQATAATRYLERQVQGFVPFSAAIRTAEQVLDPQLREAVTLMEGLRAMTPGASESLPVIPDLWGRPRETTVGLSPVAIRQEDAAPIDQELIRLRLPLNMPAKDIQGVRMKPEEYAAFVKLAGDGIVDPTTGLTAKGTLDAMVSGTHPQSAINGMYREASDGPDGGKAVIIRTVMEKYRDAARKEVLRQFPALRASVTERKRMERMALQPGS